MLLFIETSPFPAVFRTAFAVGDLAGASELTATEPHAFLARGLARAALGREAEARADFESAGSPAGLLEIGFLDLRRRAGVEELRELADTVLTDAAPESLLAARANHLAGMAENLLRRLQPATDRLLTAFELYERLGCRHGAAQVNDTLGMVLASRGRADLAALHYALSLADKALANDREGMGITLGNLGRLGLQQGRYRDAIAFFQRDIDLLKEQRNARAEARLQQDLGRAYLGLEEHTEARAALQRSRALADAGGFWDIAALSLRELALSHLAQGNLDAAASALAEARAKLPAEGQVLESAAIDAAEGQLAALRGDKTGLDKIGEAVAAFSKARLPDMEVQARLMLAEACRRHQMARSAEASLFEALKLAKAEGFLRYVRPITEALAALDLKQSAIEEAPRPIAESVSDAGSGYVIRERLGAGAFGTVFRAFDMEHGRDVALKRIHLSALYDASERQRLVASAKAELEAAAALRHPGIVRVYAVGHEANGDLYVAQELIKGEGLAKIMARPGEKSAAEVAPYLLRITQALEALHKAGIVHRDLKPGNVIVRNGWQPVLVDFGIAHVPGRAEVARENLGTLEYMAPEQAEGEAVDGRADLYALGVIAYEWLAGRRPLEVPSDFEGALKMLRKAEPVPLRKVRPDLPRELSELIEQLLEKKSRRRPESAGAVADRLLPLAT